MQVGDLVKIVQSENDRLVSPFADQVGVIVKKSSIILTRESTIDWYDVLTRDKVRSFRTDYLEVISESR